MKLDIEPGIVVEGSCGQRREVVKIEWPNLLFRQVSRGGAGTRRTFPIWARPVGSGSNSSRFGRSGKLRRWRNEP